LNCSPFLNIFWCFFERANVVILEEVTEFMSRMDMYSICTSGLCSTANSSCGNVKLCISNVLISAFYSMYVTTVISSYHIISKYVLHSWKYHLQTFKLENWSLHFVLLVLLQFYINLLIFNYSETEFI
jgi:hypothetical protein